MRLDSRIKDLNDICNPFNLNGHIETKVYGYFAGTLAKFSDLSKCDYAMLNAVDPNSSNPFLTCGELRKMYQFYIPESKLKDISDLRPFTMDEFINKFPLKSIIKLRKKSDYGIKITIIFNGYIECDNIIILGNNEFTLDELFNNYEYNNNDNYEPFGIKD